MRFAKMIALWCLSVGQGFAGGNHVVYRVVDELPPQNVGPGVKIIEAPQLEELLSVFKSASPEQLQEELPARIRASRVHWEIGKKVISFGLSIDQPCASDDETTNCDTLLSPIRFSLNDLYQIPQVKAEFPDLLSSEKKDRANVDNFLREHFVPQITIRRAIRVDQKEKVLPTTDGGSYTQAAVVVLKYWVQVDLVSKAAFVDPKADPQSTPRAATRAVQGTAPETYWNVTNKRIAYRVVDGPPVNAHSSRMKVIEDSRLNHALESHEGESAGDVVDLMPRLVYPVGFRTIGWTPGSKKGRISLQLAVGDQPCGMDEGPADSCSENLPNINFELEELAAIPAISNRYPGLSSGSPKEAVEDLDKFIRKSLKPVVTLRRYDEVVQPALLLPTVDGGKWQVPAVLKKNYRLEIDFEPRNKAS